jgi:predicted protein tyrosine phosphatase
MPTITVCPLNQIHDLIERQKPSRLISLLDPSSMIDTPSAIGADRHLKLGVNDIPSPSPGLIAPGASHVRALLDFVASWDVESPMLIHCWAGVSRSTASALIAACVLNPETPEAAIVQRIRALSPTATPNIALTAYADDMLDRGGRMVDAVRAIGQGADCFEGVPFTIPAYWHA